MESIASLFSSPFSHCRNPKLLHGSRALSKASFSAAWLTGRRSFSVSGRRSTWMIGRRSFHIRATSSSFESESSADDSAPIAPLQLESPVGQFLSEILLSHPHLVPAAVDQQLQLLQTARDEDKSNDESPSSGTELVLYRRIAEVKANERRRALEEMLYALVVQKFVEANVSLILPLSQSADHSNRMDRWFPEEEKMVQLHSHEAYVMIKNHLTLILGQRLEDLNTVAPISKLRVGQVYAASVMYGYFLKRVDERFQLEKSMKTLPWGSDEEENAIKMAIPDESRPSAQVANSISKLQTWYSPSSNSSGSERGVKSARLRSYVMSFDSDTLQRYATIRSKEAFSVVEKQTEALFGRPEIVINPQGAIDDSKDELIKISFGGLRRLILEAVTFGSFLWDVESYVESSEILHLDFYRSSTEVLLLFIIWCNQGTWFCHKRRLPA
ncbi:UV-B-induced protein At3g17800, chloroplastic isoform X2 [Dendrobium catenatum]|uniref:UV-B-induced protein At3g17800, chloroplastic isoform X2 n=1 Tax=Dendrobium catenatum TaxID=906689 RepID=UPI00109EFB96|nr:UV-B-induced protein At3g17800, chloroplastic isoform X2 [Dendrobium catenatum]